MKEAKLESVGLIKIDVEGAELEVLKGSARTPDEFHPVLIVEIVPNQLKAMGATVDDVTRFLGSHGYRASRHVDHTNVEFVPERTAAHVQ